MGLQASGYLDTEIIRLEMHDMGVKECVVVGLAHGCFIVRLPVSLFG
jgi:hypothetical protein